MNDVAEHGRWPMRRHGRDEARPLPGGKQQRYAGQRSPGSTGRGRTPSSLTSCAKLRDSDTVTRLPGRRRSSLGEAHFRGAGCRYQWSGRTGRRMTDDEGRPGSPSRSVSLNATRCRPDRAAAGSPTNRSCCSSTGHYATSRRRFLAKDWRGGGCGSATPPAASRTAGDGSGAKVNVAASQRFRCFGRVDRRGKQRDDTAW